MCVAGRCSLGSWTYVLALAVLNVVSVLCAGHADADEDAPVVGHQDGQPQEAQHGRREIVCFVRCSVIHSFYGVH